MQFLIYIFFFNFFFIFYFWGGEEKRKLENLLLNVIKMGKKQPVNVNRALAN